MIILKNLDFYLKNLVNSLSNLTGMEFAIFDSKAKLVSCTDLYLRYKGNRVHSDSIYEVLSLGNVIVNKPGYMKSCIGCRFVNNCPASIELLSCIKFNNSSIGVISLTSFSKEGHDLIQSDIEQYMDILKNASGLISMFAYNEMNKDNYLFQDAAIDKIIEDEGKNTIILNKYGIVSNCSTSAKNMFSFCNLYANSIEEIFSNDLVSWILNTNSNRSKYIATDKFTGNLTTTPFEYNNEISGFIVSLEPDIKQGLKTNNTNCLDGIVTQNPNMISIKNKIEKLSNSPSSVLITGETGTGKEMVAKAIHFTSTRKNKPFVPISCANIPGELFESEIFGYDEGAFTGARRGGKIGLFELANGGTVFLDEIGELPKHLQSKLLRVLQENTIRRLGSINDIPINIKLIVATNQDLEKLIIEDKFRKDLYYRLNVIPIKLLSLRERMDDIELLAFHFIDKYNRILNKQISSVSPKAMKALKTHRWPGNVRELENAIEYAVNMEENQIISFTHLPSNVKSCNTSILNSITTDKEFELILSTLAKYGWTVEGKKRTAKELGISLRTLYRRLEKFN